MAEKFALWNHGSEYEVEKLKDDEDTYNFSIVAYVISSHATQYTNEPIHFMLEDKDYLPQIDGWKLTDAYISKGFKESLAIATMINEHGEQVKIRTSERGLYCEALTLIQDLMHRFSYIAKKYDSALLYNLLEHPFNIINIKFSNSFSLYEINIREYMTYISKCKDVFSKEQDYSDKDRAQIRILKHNVSDLVEEVHNLDIQHFF